MTAPSFEGPLSPSSPLSLDEIVLRAEQHDADERLQFLRQVCASDDTLLSQAIERLRRGSPQWWEHSIESQVFDSEAAAQTRAGESIGSYRVIRTLGQGGMGEVVLAERDDKQFRRRVAIKLVKRGALSRNVQGRLKVERQILATL